MNEPHQPITGRCKGAATLLALAAACLLGGPAACSDPSQQSAATPTATDTREGRSAADRGIPPTGSAGMRVHIDPVTGEPVTPPAGPSEATPPEAAFSTSSAGLQETESPVPDGGVMVDLQGRFRKPLTATVDDKGNVTVGHGEKPAKAEQP